MRNRLYQCWSDMNRRCRAKRGYLAERYHKRGIRVCTEWSDFHVFEKWALSHGYRDDLTIDRIDNDSGYSPSNCRWATRKQQSRNTSSNRVVTIRDKRMTLQEAIELGCVKWNTARGRVRRGVPVEEAVSREAKERRPSVEIDAIVGESPVSRKLIACRLRKGWSKDLAGRKKYAPGEHSRKLISFRGETRSISEWARVTGVSRTTLSRRLSSMGWSTERALTEKVRGHK